MTDRRVSTVISAVAVFLVCAVLWDAFSAPRVRPRRHASLPADPAQQRPAPGIALPEAARVVPPASPPPEVGAQVSYIDQVARAENRRRIRASAGYTYLDQVVQESQDSSLHRWDDRVRRPVRVYLPGSTVEDFRPEFLDAVRGAFQRWEEAGVPVRFDLGADSGSANVVFAWRVQFDIDRTGQTNLTWDRDGDVQSGVVTIATRDPNGRPLSADDVRVVALHEIGHLLGLDHSSDSTDIMFARTQARELSGRDIRTAQLLYQLAPGPLR
jgi:hypothetical protein